MYYIKEDLLAGVLKIEMMEGYRAPKESLFEGTYEECIEEKKRLEGEATPIFVVFRTREGEKIIKKESKCSGNWRGNKYLGYTILGEYDTLEEAKKYADAPRVGVWEDYI